MQKAIKDADPYISHPSQCSDGPLFPCHPTFPDSPISLCQWHTVSTTSRTQFICSFERHRWDPIHLHTFPSIIPASTEDGRKGRNVAMPGTPQSKPCVASTKVCTILQLIFQKSPCHQPMNGTLQQAQY